VVPRAESGRKQGACLVRLSTNLRVPAATCPRPRAADPRPLRAGLRVCGGDVQQPLRALVDQLEDRPEDGGIPARDNQLLAPRFGSVPGASRAIAAAPSQAASARRSRCRARTYSERYSPPMLVGRRATQCSRSGTWAATAVGRARDAPDREHRTTYRQPAAAEDDMPDCVDKRERGSVSGARFPISASLGDPA
jgi:hypothetical protein